MEPLLNYTIVQKANWTKLACQNFAKFNFGKLGRSLTANNGIPILVISFAHSSVVGAANVGPAKTF